MPPNGQAKQSGAPSKFETDSSKLQPYLLGAWQEVWVDPNAWAFGPVPVSHFVVKAAARPLMMRLRAADSEFSVADGRRPRLWPGPDGMGGLLSLEQRWQALYTTPASVSDCCVLGIGLVAAGWGMLSVRLL
jgi:hypothetical protein